MRAARRFPAGCRYCVRSHTAAARKGGMTDAMLGMLTTTPHAMGHAACSQARPASLLMRVCPAVPRGRRAAGGGGDVQRDKPPRPGPSSSQLPGSEIKWLQPQRISRFHLCVVFSFSFSFSCCRYHVTCRHTMCLSTRCFSRNLAHLLSRRLRRRICWTLARCTTTKHSVRLATTPAGERVRDSSV